MCSRLQRDRPPGGAQRRRHLYAGHCADIEQDMLYAMVCLLRLGWLLLFVLLDALFAADLCARQPAAAEPTAELCACLLGTAVRWHVLTFAPRLLDERRCCQRRVTGRFIFPASRALPTACGKGSSRCAFTAMAKDGYGYAPSLFYGELLLYFPAVLRLLGMSVQRCIPYLCCWQFSC